MIKNLNDGTNENEDVNDGINENEDVNDGINKNEDVNDGTNENEDVNDGLNDGTIENEDVNEDVKISKGKTFTETESTIYRIIQQNPLLSEKNLAKEVNKSKSTVYRAIMKLKDKGLIMREGSDKNGRWVCVDKAN